MSTITTKIADTLGKTSLDAVDAFLQFARRYEWTPMPGYTHMQRAMLSSVGLWAASFAESLLDDRALLRAVYEIVDQSPQPVGLQPS